MERLSRRLFGQWALGMGAAALSAACCPSLVCSPEPTPAPTKKASTVVFILDATGSFRPFYPRAREVIADSIDAQVFSGQAGLTIYLQFVTSASYPTNRFERTILIPAVADEPIKSEKGWPPPSPSKQQSIDDEYRKSVEEHRKRLEQVRAAVKQETDWLRSFVPPADPRPGSDIWGATLRAGARLSAASGDRSLILATDLDDSRFSAVAADRAQADHLALSDVDVIAAFLDCPSSAQCDRRKQAWRDVFKRAKARSVAFLDPGQSGGNLLAKVKEARQ